MLYELVDRQHDMLIMHMLWHRFDKGYISCYDVCMIMECMSLCSLLVSNEYCFPSSLPDEAWPVLHRYSIYYITRRLHGGRWEHRLSIITLCFLYAHVDHCYHVSCVLAEFHGEYGTHGMF